MAVDPGGTGPGPGAEQRPWAGTGNMTLIRARSRARSRASPTRPGQSPGSWASRLSWPRRLVKRRASSLSISELLSRLPARTGMPLMMPVRALYGRFSTIQQ